MVIPPNDQKRKKIFSRINNINASGIKRFKYGYVLDYEDAINCNATFVRIEV